MTLGLKLYSTVVRVRDLSRAEEWCERVLGCRPDYRDLHYRLVTYGIKTPPRLTLWELPPDGSVDRNNSRGVIPVFTSDNLESECARLKQLGVETGPITAFHGGLWFLFRDPDGNPFVMVHIVPDEPEYTA